MNKIDFTLVHLLLKIGNFKTIIFYKIHSLIKVD